MKLMVHPSKSYLEFYGKLRLASSSHLGTIWYRVIKSKPSSITAFRKLPHVCFSKAHATTLPKITQHNFLQNWPLFHRLHCASLRKTLVLGILHGGIMSIFEKNKWVESHPFMKISTKKKHQKITIL
jgi:hypothetical protein